MEFNFTIAMTQHETGFCKIKNMSIFDFYLNDLEANHKILLP